MQGLWLYNLWLGDNMKTVKRSEIDKEVVTEYRYSWECPCCGYINYTSQDPIEVCRCVDCDAAYEITEDMD